MRWAVLLAGGSGTRFWPLSTPRNPKQLLPLSGAASSAEEAVERLSGLMPRDRIFAVTGHALADRLREALHLPAANVLVEPVAASTAPALIWATWEAQRRDPDAEVLSLHADWAVGDAAAFRRTADLALSTARTHDRLVTVGVVPSRPETGYGYIVPGAPLDDSARTVARFSEKPDAATALDLMADGALWNTGLFAWTARRLLEEVAHHTPEVAPALARLRDNDVLGFFRAVTPISIDVGLLERSGSVAVVTGDFSWDDVGTWAALARVRPKDPSGNIVVGKAFLHESQDCIVWSDGDPIVLSGVQDLVVVHAHGRILVMPVDRAPGMKQLLDALPAEIRDLDA
jgi:mannose-1-phosphate guanylyltransferase